MLAMAMALVLLGLSSSAGARFQPRLPTRLSATIPSGATARGRAAACHTSHCGVSHPPALGRSLGPDEYVIKPSDYGADPSGATDSTTVLQHCVQLLWNASRPSTSGIVAASDHQLDLGGATLDLAGGVFLLSSPVVFPATGARNFQVRGGTLRAARTFPEARFLLELNYTEKSYVENVASNPPPDPHLIPT